MKKLQLLLAIFFVLLINTSTTPAKAQVNIDFQFYYDNLSPYGSWIDYPDYGYVWHPNEENFQPYRTNGHWVWSDDYGWTWVSNYDWGWAPFHYGRWYDDPYEGWVWVPGYDWSPAWVTWRGDDQYYGWAPMEPEIGLSFVFGTYSPQPDYWTFVPSQYIASPYAYNYYVPAPQNTVIINKTRIINNYYSGAGRNVYVTGPNKTMVERVTGQKINSVKVRDASAPGRANMSGNDVAIYRPKVSHADQKKARPANFIQANKGNVKTNVSRDAHSAKVLPEKNVSTNSQKSNAKADWMKPEIPKNQHTKAAPIKKQDAVFDPLHGQSNKTKAGRTEPVRQPQKVQQQKSQPAHTQPVKQQQQKMQPARPEPMQQQKTQPVHSQPMRQQQPQPMHQQQMKAQQQPQQMHQQQPKPQQQKGNSAPQGGGGKGKKN
jgi:hypothetical protein